MSEDQFFRVGYMQNVTNLYFYYQKYIYYTLQLLFAQR